MLTKSEGYEPLIYFQGAIKAILEKNPLERLSLFNYLCSIAFSDNQIKEKEVDFILNVGQNLLGYSPKEVYKMLAYNISREFIPSPWNGV